MKRKYKYQHARIAKHLYRRGANSYYIRYMVGERGSKRYLQLTLPARTADLAIKLASPILERFREKRQKEALAQFKKESSSI
jgi:hypothetical protein